MFTLETLLPSFHQIFYGPLVDEERAWKCILRWISSIFLVFINGGWISKPNLNITWVPSIEKTTIKFLYAQLNTLTQVSLV
jgi:hypothetical protein